MKRNANGVLNHLSQNMKLKVIAHACTRNAQAEHANIFVMGENLGHYFQGVAQGAPQHSLLGTSERLIAHKNAVLFTKTKCVGNETDNIETQRHQHSRQEYILNQMGYAAYVAYP